MAHRHGVITGALRNAEYRVFETSLQPRQMLLCYTDGLVEHRSSDVDTGIRTLCATITAPHLPERLNQLVPAVINAVGPDSGRDDICVLALRRIEVSTS